MYFLMVKYKNVGINNVYKRRVPKCSARVRAKTRSQHALGHEQGHRCEAQTLGLVGEIGQFV